MVFKTEIFAQKSYSKERRSGKDRRTSAGPVSCVMFKGGRREKNRRREDQRKIFCADRYSPTLFGAIILILFLSVLDALLTLFLIDHGATEINPIMAYYLNVGPYTFFCVKYALTALAVLVLLFCQNIFLRTIKIYTHSIFYFIVAALMTVVAWELYLIFNVVT
jgi:hypothetical protein